MAAIGPAGPNMNVMSEVSGGGEPSSKTAPSSTSVPTTGATSPHSGSGGGGGGGGGGGQVPRLPLHRVTTGAATTTSSGGGSASLPNPSSPSRTTPRSSRATYEPLSFRGDAPTTNSGTAGSGGGGGGGGGGPTSSKSGGRGSVTHRASEGPSVALDANAKGPPRPSTAGSGVRRRFTAASSPSNFNVTHNDDRSGSLDDPAAAAGGGGRTPNGDLHSRRLLVVSRVSSDARAPPTYHSPADIFMGGSGSGGTSGGAGNGPGANSGGIDSARAILDGGGAVERSGAVYTRPLTVNTSSYADRMKGAMKARGIQPSPQAAANGSGSLSPRRVSPNAIQLKRPFKQGSAGGSMGGSIGSTSGSKGAVGEKGRTGHPPSTLASSLYYAEPRHANGYNGFETQQQPQEDGAFVPLRGGFAPSRFPVSRMPKNYNNYTVAAFGEAPSNRQGRPVISPRQRPRSSGERDQLQPLDLSSLLRNLPMSPAAVASGTAPKPGILPELRASVTFEDNIRRLEAQADTLSAQLSATKGPSSPIPPQGLSRPPPPKDAKASSEASPRSKMTSSVKGRQGSSGPAAVAGSSSSSSASSSSSPSPSSSSTSASLSVAQSSTSVPSIGSTHSSLEKVIVHAGAALYVDDVPPEVSATVMAALKGGPQGPAVTASLRVTHESAKDENYVFLFGVDMVSAFASFPRARGVLFDYCRCYGAPSLGGDATEGELTLVALRNEAVEGTVLRLSDKDLALLAHSKGFPSRSSRLILPVCTTVASERVKSTFALPHVVNAHVYLVEESKLKGDLVPSAPELSAMIATCSSFLSSATVSALQRFLAAQPQSHQDPLMIAPTSGGRPLKSEGARAPARDGPSSSAVTSAAVTPAAAAVAAAAMDDDPQTLARKAALESMGLSLEAERRLESPLSIAAAAGRGPPAPKKDEGGGGGGGGGRGGQRPTSATSVVRSGSVATMTGPGASAVPVTSSLPLPSSSSATALVGARSGERVNENNEGRPPSEGTRGVPPSAGSVLSAQPVMAATTAATSSSSSSSSSTTMPSSSVSSSSSSSSLPSIAQPSAGADDDNADEVEEVFLKSNRAGESAGGTGGGGGARAGAGAGGGGGGGGGGEASVSLPSTALSSSSSSSSSRVVEGAVPEDPSRKVTVAGQRELAEQEAAAIKIQAQVRGANVRKSLDSRLSAHATASSSSTVESPQALAETQTEASRRPAPKAGGSANAQEGADAVAARKTALESMGLSLESDDSSQSGTVMAATADDKGSGPTLAEQEAAAIKIQAQVRGANVRKTVKVPSGSARSSAQLDAATAAGMQAMGLDAISSSLGEESAQVALSNRSSSTGSGSGNNSARVRRPSVSQQNAMASMGFSEEFIVMPASVEEEGDDEEEMEAGRGQGTVRGPSSTVSLPPSPPRPPPSQQSQPSLEGRGGGGVPAPSAVATAATSGSSPAPAVREGGGDETSGMTEDQAASFIQATVRRKAETQKAAAAAASATTSAVVTTTPVSDPSATATGAPGAAVRGGVDKGREQEGAEAAGLRGSQTRAPAMTESGQAPQRTSSTAPGSKMEGGSTSGGDSGRGESKTASLEEAGNTANRRKQLHDSHRDSLQSMGLESSDEDESEREAATAAAEAAASASKAKAEEERQRAESLKVMGFGY